jgi:MSHA pilin protein MshD
MSINSSRNANASIVRRQRGVTLVELVIAIIIISVAVTGVLLVFSITVKSSADPVIVKQMNSVAEEMMEEIALKPFGKTSVVPAGCARKTYVGISDYNNYSSPSKICDIDGNTVLTGYSINVAVVPDAAGLPGVTDTKRITITVTNGSQNITLVSWRTNYGS